MVLLEKKMCGRVEKGEALSQDLSCFAAAFERFSAQYLNRTFTVMFWKPLCSLTTTNSWKSARTPTRKR